MRGPKIRDREGRLGRPDVDELRAQVVLRRHTGQACAEDGLDGGERGEDAQWLGIVGYGVVGENVAQCAEVLAVDGEDI